MMTPVKLYVWIEPDPSRLRADTRYLLVTSLTQVRGDVRVTVWWSGGRGEVHFRLATGVAEKKSVPYRIRKDSAWEVVKVIRASWEAGEGGMRLPEAVGQPGWWANP